MQAANTSNQRREFARLLAAELVALLLAAPLVALLFADELVARLLLAPLEAALATLTNSTLKATAVTAITSVFKVFMESPSGYKKFTGHGKFAVSAPRLSHRYRVEFAVVFLSCFS